MIKRKYTRKEIEIMIEIRVIESRIKFKQSLHPIIRKLFGNYLVNIYNKGGDDMLADFKYFRNKFKKLGIK